MSSEARGAQSNSQLSLRRAHFDCLYLTCPLALASRCAVNGVAALLTGQLDKTRKNVGWRGKILVGRVNPERAPPPSPPFGGPPKARSLFSNQ
jgi:hypothetical protein